MSGADLSLEGQLVWAIRSGEVAAVERLLAEQPELATGRIHGFRTALHVVTDWPGYTPNGPRIAARLLASGADPNAVTVGERPETPLHWAASTDDVEVAVVLLDGGAGLEAPGGSIGTPLANAIGYGCWHVARLLVDRGARVEELWQAAALGLQHRVEEILAAGRSDGPEADAAQAHADPAQTDPGPTSTAPKIDPQQLTDAFWQACSGGQRRVAEYLLARGADINGRPRYAGHSAVRAAAAPDTRRDLMVTWLREQGAADT